MERTRAETRSVAERLIHMVELHSLYHVKTLCYEDAQGALQWLGWTGVGFDFGEDEDTVTVLKRFVELKKLSGVGVVGVFDEPQIRGKDRLVVHVKRNAHAEGAICKYDSIVLFLVTPGHAKAPLSPEQCEVIRDARAMLSDSRAPLFPGLAACPWEPVEPIPQQQRPVIDGVLPSSYDTTKPRNSVVTTDNFGRTYVPLKRTNRGSPWSVYTDITAPGGSECGGVDVNKLICTRNKVLGRGGFGITVLINDRMVAKTNLFPEMANWSIPFIEHEFNRYAHIASQVEEAMIGVSIKHPNILRTFGGFWCENPGYQLGGRAVLVMERALMSLQEFISQVQGTSVFPLVELDTLQGLDYLRSRTIQHKDFTYRNVLVCHQPGRTPVPFAFKISDFGTSCNFSTPDQPRGNRTNMAPEVLWCLNAATGSDVFSWYCVMWELHSARP
ncbi:hypothetical protein KUCAC02_025100 [Chaenocephalus aceratus]|nr:hypothetical protein KUCAC02_025100 [Chaenocephalus aceratus]